MTIDDLIAQLKPILPNFLIDQENDGEILIFSGFREATDGSLEEVPDPD
jgi:hypothetical protein